ncbi:M13 family metallopeptidase [Lactococcus termiticola]|uniref:Endopeptidase n=1 Tax=Lactococcus termiticola TaxID=2169526 RepID=A0A2R5HIE2_9LACT|nr:M13-type metalloendopeptidase [Lactococcus termiticola]GBG97305.1 endopeptidase [Lactococcus termiticola]
MTRIQDDLFEAVNAEWLAKTEIPSDRPRIAAFDELVIENEKRLAADMKALSELSEQESPELTQAIAFYKKAGDWTTRNADDFSAVKKELDKIASLATFEDFKDSLADIALHSQASLPFSFGVQADMKDAVHYALGFTGPGLLLPDKTYYGEDHPRKQELLDFWAKNTAELLATFGMADAEKLADQAVAFDGLLVESANSSEEWAKYAELYNPIAVEDFATQVTNIDVKAFVESLLGRLPEQIIVFENRFYESFDRLIAPENWELIKAWMLTKIARKATGYLSEEVRILGGAYGRFLQNVAEARNQEKHQLDVTEGYFSQVIGLYYGKKYFGEAAKADVKRMVEVMIKVYQSRLLSNDWLSQATAEQAVEKLDAITPMIGYPDKLPKVLSKLVVDADQSLYENAVKFDEILTARHYEKFSEEVDKTEWHMPAHMVNAYYSPDSNTIVFPAAILQAPFYDNQKQTASQNYGGIGAVIAHEISHAFDNNGAQFDKFGNLNKWWTDEDYTAFEKKQEEMIAEFDGLETEAGKANGRLIVSENIADQGGITAALTAAKLEPDYSAEEFFKQWAEIWRIKASTEYQQMLLSSDVHAPGKLRANVPPTNLEDFFEAFDIKPGDGMWRAEEDRVKIW